LSDAKLDVLVAAAYLHDVGYGRRSRTPTSTRSTVHASCDARVNRLKPSQAYPVRFAYGVSQSSRVTASSLLRLTQIDPSTAARPTGSPPTLLDYAS